MLGDGADTAERAGRVVLKPPTRDGSLSGNRRMILAGPTSGERASEADAAVPEAGAAEGAGSSCIRHWGVFSELRVGFQTPYSKKVEKHFTLNPELKGNDHYHSITPEILSTVLASIKRMINLYKVKSTQIPTDTELQAREGARRSLYFTRDLAKGHILSHDDIIELRPARFTSASSIDEFIGQQLTTEITKDSPVTKDLFENE